MTLLEAMADRNLFAPWFRDSTTWAAWRAFIAALFALPMTPEQLTIYQQSTGRVAPPQQSATEAWLICGRRAGKSFILALCAVFLACFFEYRKFLAPGERGTVLIIATNSKQARVIVRYVRALLTHIPMLAKLIERETADAFDLSNSVTIEVHPASAKSTRGYAVVAALLDEVAFFPTDDSANPDYDILDAIRPGMATIPNAMLLCASSPYARRGALWDAHRRHFGRDGDPVLVWRAPTRTMNPSVSQQVIDAAAERDPASAAAEWLAEFRSDIESFINREAVEACIAWGVRERAPMQSVRYYGFVDPSGGSADSMTLATGHREDDIVVVDALREIKPPFSPESAVAEFSELLKSYHVIKITGDRYAGEWPRERFREHGIVYEPAQKPKSDLYRDLLPAINSRKLDLLDDARLLTQLVSLERRTARGGRDSIDHAPGAHDDLANALAGLAAATRSKYRYDSSLDWVAGPDYGKSDADAA
jgi:terminase large subunit-like protein